MKSIPALLAATCLVTLSARAEDLTIGPAYADAPEIKAKDGVP